MSILTQLIDEAEAQAEMEAQAQADREHKLWLLDNCQDVEDLKSFIRDHLLT